MLLPQTPQPPVQVWSRGIALGTRIYGKLFLFTSVLAVFGLLPRLDLGLRLGDRLVTLESLRGSLGGRWLAIELICVLLSLLVQAVIVVRVAQFSGAQSSGTAGSWRPALRSWLPLLGTVVLCALILIFAALVATIVGSIVGAAGKALLGKAGAEAIVMLLLSIAVIFVGVYLVFVQFAVVLEGKRPLAAIDLSFNLVRKNWWRTFAVLLITAVVLAGVLLLVSLPADAAFGWHGGVQTGRLMVEKSILQMVLSALAAPFIITILYVQYLDLKLRHAASAAAPTATFQA